MRGVCWNTTNRRWRACLGSKYLGEFISHADACSARNCAEVARFGISQVAAEPITNIADTRLPIFDRAGQVVCWALIDTDDLYLVQHHRWCRTASGYPVARINGRIAYLHRILIPDGPLADHRDRDRMNNRRSNLRTCNVAENARNTSLGANNRSGFKGVSQVPGSKLWRARIMSNRREVGLGRFSTREEAARAYDAAAERHHGSFASPNFHSARPEMRIVVRPATREIAA